MFLTRFLDFGGSFSRYFQIVPAWSDALKEEAYRIRHQVYCEELGWESVRSDLRETDEFDMHSLHLLIRAVASDAYIGCIRLIRTDPNAPDDLLPFEKTCAGVLDRTVCDPSRLPREHIAEVSRLAVIAPYRRRKGESGRPVSMEHEDFGTPDQPRFLYAPIALYMAALELARLNDVSMLFTLTEPRLASHFCKLGAKVTPVGPPVEHRGVRIPSMVNVNEVIRRIPRIFRPLYRVIAEEVGRCPVSWNPALSGAPAPAHPPLSGIHDARTPGR
ncbi:MAG: PEP-CTERM/exosortase system-associated acyltransferase [Rhodocyclaceae bacterium]|nr:PEP-CTERM/exosortase system-associated acyltransferase [Rhodocyclaceae bacterium]